MQTETDVTTLRFEELVNLDRLRTLLERFAEMNGCPATLVSYPEQHLLIQAGWREACSRFHRVVPASNAICVKSNIDLTSRLEDANDISIERCENGLVDGAVPIILEGRHIASLATGQVLFEPPDLDWFRSQAEKFGYDVDAYLDAIRETPVVSEQQFRHTLRFLQQLAVGCAEQGLRSYNIARAKNEIQEQEALLRTLMNTLPDMVWLKDPDGVFKFCNSRFELLYNATEADIAGKTDYDFVSRELADFFRDNDRRAMEAGESLQNDEEVTFASDGHHEMLETIKTPMYNEQGTLLGVLGIARDITKRKQVEEALEKRIIALTLPLDDPQQITFDALFNLDDIQRLQDDFSNATGVASLITHPNGEPITRPSNFCRLCNDIIRKTEKGLHNCYRSDARIGQLNPVGPTVRICLCGVLWDAGAGISVGGRHVANWLIGQVRDESQTSDSIRMYAREIGADEEEMVAAFQETTAMSHKTFNMVAKFLHTLANQLSEKAYQNVQQARFIADRNEAIKSLANSETKFRSYIENAPYGVFITDQTGRYVEVNQAAIDISGYSRRELLSMTVIDIMPPDHREEGAGNFKQLVEHGMMKREVPYLHKTGETRYWFVSAIRLSNDRLLCVAEDSTERRNAEKAVRESEQRLQALINSTPDIICFKDGQGRWLVANNADIELFSLQDVDYRGKTDSELADFAHPMYREAFLACEKSDELTWLAKSIRRNEEIIPRIDGEERIFDVIKAPIFEEDGERKGLVVLGRDITQRIRGEQERQKLEEQLQHALKMESVGRLAGGVAHDFNNMLGVILGNTDLALSQLPEDHPVTAELKEIYKAAERSANLTRQLLAFARKQTVEPRVLDLNRTVEGMLKMLRRLIGEDIDLVWCGGDNLWPVRIDPSQIDQILANLCINARDAIEGAGKIVIETANVAIDEEAAANRPGYLPGEFVRLTVSDTGKGIDKSVLPNIFDPYFSTKDIGKGTGLGLATVYGIAKQNQGFIDVDSEPGQGSTFQIYLPRTHSLAYLQNTESSARKLKGQETILLVEDEPAILSMTKKMLEKQGYTILAASTPSKGIRLAESNADSIDLLITDVIMPEMNGRELAKNLLQINPRMKRVFMSGYTADVIAHHGVLDPGVHFIQKPFKLNTLLEKIREVLSE